MRADAFALRPHDEAALADAERLGGVQADGRRDRRRSYGVEPRRRRRARPECRCARETRSSLPGRRAVRTVRRASTAPTGAGACGRTSSASSGVSAPSTGSTSTNHGIKPAWTAACAVAANVQAGIMHSRPGAISSAARISTSAAVPLASSVSSSRARAGCSREACFEPLHERAAVGVAARRVDLAQVRQQLVDAIGSSGRRRGSDGGRIGVPGARRLAHVRVRAGLPATTASAATSLTTTEPMPMSA